MRTIQANIFIVFVLIASLAFSCSLASKHKRSYIEKACKAATDHDLCIKSLKSFSNIGKKSYLKWAKAAVQVSIDEAKNTQKYLNESQKNTHMTGENKMGISLCIVDLENTLRQLQQSFDILNKLRTKGFKTQIRFADISLSAALNYHSSCLDNYEGQKGKDVDALRNRVQNSRHFSNIALGFVHKVEKIGSKSLSKA